jgi:hypothetical protein
MTNLSSGKRRPETGERVFVYFNLRRKQWSVKSLETGSVIHHANFVWLMNCMFKVSEAGRKNVHPGVEGYWVDTGVMLVDDPKVDPLKAWALVAYIPTYESFVRLLSTAKIVYANGVCMNGRSIFATNHDVRIA